MARGAPAPRKTKRLGAETQGPGAAQLRGMRQQQTRLDAAVVAANQLLKANAEEFKCGFRAFCGLAAAPGSFPGLTAKNWRVTLSATDASTGRHTLTFDGPIALVRDPKRLIAAGAQKLVPEMTIFHSAGQVITRFEWLEPGLVAMGWTADERLVCVFRQSRIQVLSIRGKMLNSFPIQVLSTRGKMLNSFPIKGPSDIGGAVFWPEGVVVREASTSRLWSIDGISSASPTLKQLADVRLSGPPSAMEVIPPEHSARDSVEVLLATPDGSITVVDDLSAVDQQIRIPDASAPDGFRRRDPYERMSVSPNGQFVACYSREKVLDVFGTDFSKHICAFSASSRDTPLMDVAWCGSDSVVLLFQDGELVVVGPNGEHITFDHDPPVRMITELDGLRVITDQNCEFLSLVPESTQEIYTVGSLKPAAMLKDAAIEFYSGKAQADDSMRSIKTRKDKIRAVRACLDAARHEFDLDTQTELLRAAAFGKLFIEPRASTLFSADDDDSDDEWDPANEFSDTCRSLRVLNALRSKSLCAASYKDAALEDEPARGGGGGVASRDMLSSWSIQSGAERTAPSESSPQGIGMPLSFAQYERLTFRTVVHRLVNRRHHLVALRMCEYLRESAFRNDVLVHWAVSKIENAAPDSVDNLELGREIRAKLAPYAGLSFAEMARAASGVKRYTLATLLLENEPRAVDQIQMLVEMGEWELALKRACASGDSDLVYFVLVKLLGKMGARLDELFQIVVKQPLAVGLFRRTLQNLAPDNLFREEHCPAMPLDILDRFVAFVSHKDTSQMGLLAAMEAEHVEDRVQLVEVAEGLFKQTGDLFASKSCAEFSMLLDLHTAMEQEDGNKYVGLSVSETLAELLRRGDDKRAKRFAKQFNVSEGRYWHTNIGILAAKKNWTALWEFAQSQRKPPIGYMPFVDACLAQSEHQEAVKYIKLLPDHRDQLTLLAQLGLWKSAVDVAATHRDQEALELIRDQCGDAEVIRLCNEMLH